MPIHSRIHRPFVGEHLHDTIQRNQLLLPAREILQLNLSIVKFRSQYDGLGGTGSRCLAQELADVSSGLVAATSMDSGSSQRSQQPHRRSIGLVTGTEDEDPWKEEID